MITNSIEEFYKYIRKDGIILSIDYGLRKTGIAISTPNLALPLEIIIEKQDKKKISRIVDLIKQKNICGIVIGLPLNMDSSYSNLALIVKKFANKLQFLNLPIFLQDERLSSKLAGNISEILYSNKGNDDAIAASLILDTVLKSMKHL